MQSYSASTRPMPPPAFDPMGPASEPLRLLEIIASCRRRWKLIAALTLMGTGLSLYIVLRIVPLYTSEVLIEIAGRRNDIVSVESLTDNGRPEIGLILTEAQELRSPTLAGQVVDELRLGQDPEFNGVEASRDWLHRGTDALRADFAYYLNKVASQLGVDIDLGPVPPPPTASAVRQHAVETLRERMDVSTDDRSYLIKLRLSTTDPVKTASILNTYAHRYLDMQLANKLDSTSQLNQWLTDRLKVMADKMRQSSEAIQQFRESHKLLASEGSTISTNELTALYDRWVAAKADATAAAAELEAARQDHGGGRPDPTAFSGPLPARVGPSPLIHSLLQKQADLAARAADMRTMLGAQHPSVLAVQAQVADLQKEIVREKQHIMEGLQAAAWSAQARADALERSVLELRKQITNVNESEVGLLALQGAADADRQVYVSLLAKVRDTSGGGEYPVRNAHIVADAQVSLRPSYPKRQLLTGAGAVGSLFLGISLALWQERRRLGFVSSIEVEQALGLPAAGMIPLTGAHSAVEEVWLRPRSLYSEAVRSIWPTLSSWNDGTPKTLMLTSSLPGEGKSILAVSLAHALVDAGKRVVVVDLDLRRPGLSQHLNLTGRPGLVAVIDHRRLVDDCLIAGRGGPSILPSDALNENPQRLLTSPRFRELLADLKTRYDVIILDSPPALAVSDAALVARFADGILYAVRWLKTPRAAAIAGLKQLRSLPTPIIGVVLTQVDLRVHSKYGFGDAALFYRLNRRYYGE